jgi:divalent metal cation (Fe/Co/Zn/Cd) transporter
MSLNGSQSRKQAHDLTEEIELAIQWIVPEADVTVHPEPVESQTREGE